MRRALLVTAVVLAWCASLETGPPASVEGRWTGECYHCSVRTFTLVLTQDGERLTGTLQAVEPSGLGNLPMVLYDGRVTGRVVRFRTHGVDGVPHGTPFGLRFTRGGR